MKNSRRRFIKRSVAASAAVSFGAVLPGFSAKSYANIMGANDRIKVGVMGVNARGLALAQNFAYQKNCEVIYISDVDSRAMDKCVDAVKKIQDSAPSGVADFRKVLEDKALDAMIIATPDHWHAPAAILSCKAGKHVYVEKPCSHNPHEGELLVAAARKYNRKVQMGSQRRSWPNIITAIQELKEGVIGRAYYGKGWYANNRPSIGNGKKAEVPSWLNYDLWQGPAPREAFRDNMLHYNWHWFWNWGTGEGGNNGTHTVDMLRWGMGVEYPISVNSSGGRYRYTDDWETPDTQVVTWNFSNNSMMEWEGRSCNNRNIEEEAVGVVFYGEKGSLVIGAGNTYKIYDLQNKLIKDVKDTVSVDARNTVDPSKNLDALHIQNFFDGIRKGASLNADIEIGHTSTLLTHLGNIALRTASVLKIDESNGRIIGNKEASAFWKRKYAPGWEPAL
ncbi:MAG: Gfo/Idh/MocA family oxidoreductase [Chitinophagaceae bacterium]|nr:Gfo/Idh/MocA family oxidoreductase [Chitinophagaceae bacterium]